MEDLKSFGADNFKYRVPPTTEVIEGKVCERIHFLDAVEKYPDGHIVFVNGAAVGDLSVEPDDFVATIVGIFEGNEDFSRVKWELRDKGYPTGERRTTEGASVLWLG